MTLVILNIEFGLIWATPWPDEKQLFLKFSKIRNSRNWQNSVWEPHFFRGTLCQKLLCFTLSLHWWYSIPRLVWFGQHLNPMKKPIFKIYFSRKFAKFRTKTQFFSEASSTIFLLYTVITLVILNTEFGLIWSSPWLDGKQLFLKFSKIHNSRISQNSVWKTIFSQASYTNNFFALHSHYTGDTHYRVWLDLDNSLTRWKRIFF